MTAFAYRFAERMARILIALGILAFVASCGGSVNGVAPANDPTRITILPSTATLYAGQATTFTISGGTGTYIMSSSNQAVIPISGSVPPQVTVVPNQVSADTDVTLTVRDTGSTPLATATLTVKVGTINNEVVITPSSTQGTICPLGTLCSGGDALVTVTLSQGGVALAGRSVRFDAVSGDFRFITSATATTETLSTSVTATTDDAGHATVRIRATVDAPNQTAILQATDLVSGATRRASFVIAQATGTSPGFFISPSSTTFQGAFTDRCAGSDVTSSFYVFGGTPPYTVQSTSAGLAVNRNTLGFSGDGFNVTPLGFCVTNAEIIVRDAAGRTATATVSNIPGTTPVPPLTVAPTSVTLTSCSGIASVVATGGTGHYLATSGSPGVMVVPVASGIFNIQRVATSPATAGPVNVGISDGVSSVTATVNLTGAGAGQCPPSPITFTPSGGVTLPSCTSTVQVSLSGGTGVYSVSTNSGSIKVSIAGNVVTIGRNPGLAQSGHVFASDGVSAPAQLAVTDSAGSCP